ncbi:MAG: DNA translocase FtsK 4TM domain-containing protein, partial [Gammaproteobacteria bacterium]|nr:DNA translocase FtsK 4TM domain-containing protein [Gammaproteobacteria bacterium]
AFGYFAFLLPFAFVYVAWAVIKDFHSLKFIDRSVLFLRSAGFILMVLGGCGLLSLQAQIKAVDSIHSAGGIIGQAVSNAWYHMLNIQGATLVLLAMLLVGTTWLTGLSWLRAIELIGAYTLLAVNAAYFAVRKIINLSHEGVARYKSREVAVAPVEVQNKEKSLPRLFRPKKEKEVEREKPVPVLIVPAERRNNTDLSINFSE